MNKNSKCNYCGEKIPVSRHKSAKYCTDEHSYQAKKERSTQRYYRIKQPMDEIQRNDAILERLYRMKKDLKREFAMSDLEKLGFNFGVSTEEKTDSTGRIWKILGSFGYTIDPKTKILYLWQKH